MNWRSTQSTMIKNEVRPSKINLNKMIALLAICLSLASAAFSQSPRPTAQPGSAAGAQETVSLGILDFQNESGLNVRPDLVRKITRDLRWRFISNHKGLLPRPISAGGDSPTDMMTIEQLATLGRQYDAGFVIRGGLLGLATENDGEGAIVRAQLYADVISVESAGITTLRAEGVGARDGASASAGVNGSLLGYSAQERALSSAIEQLASAIHQALTQAPVADEQAMDSTVAGQENAQAAPVAPRGADEAEAGEDMRRLIAQADGLISRGVAHPEFLESLSRAIEKLKAALTLKATLLEQGEDTGEADSEIAARREDLRSVISAIAEKPTSSETSTPDTEDLPSGETPTPDTEDLPSGETSAFDDQQSSGDGRSALARVNEYLSEMSSIIQKIQEMRAAFYSDKQEATSEGTIPAGEGGEETLPAEEETEEVSGVDTEPGAPVEGEVVTRPESGASATTGSSGSYNLKGAPVGRLVDLTIQKNGKKGDPRRVEAPLSVATDFGFEAKSFVGDSRPVTIAPVGSNGLIVTAKKTKSPSVKLGSQGKDAVEGVRWPKKSKSKSEKKGSQGIGAVEEVRWPKKLKSKSEKRGSRSRTSSLPDIELPLLKSKSEKRRSQGIGAVEGVRWPKKLKSPEVKKHGSRRVEPPPPRPPVAPPKSPSVKLGSRAAAVERFQWPSKPHPPTVKPGLRVTKQR